MLYVSIKDIAGTSVLSFSSGSWEVQIKVENGHWFIDWEFEGIWKDKGKDRLMVIMPLLYNHSWIS